MKGTASAALLALVLCGCSAVKPAASTPQPQSYVPIAGSWTVAVSGSSSAPSGWTLPSQSVTLQTVPVNPCLSDFATLMSPNTMKLPGAFLACADSTDIPLPAGQSMWLQTAVMGTTTADLYSGEPVYYVLQYNSADGSTIALLGGEGTFTSSTTTANGTTSFTYQVSGPIDCLTINSSITSSCNAWHTTFTATLN